MGATRTREDHNAHCSMNFFGHRVRLGKHVHCLRFKQTGRTLGEKWWFGFYEECVGNKLQIWLNIISIEECTCSLSTKWQSYSLEIRQSMQSSCEVQYMCTRRVHVWAPVLTPRSWFCSSFNFRCWLRRGRWRERDVDIGEYTRLRRRDMQGCHRFIAHDGMHSTPLRVFVIANTAPAG